MATRPLSRKVLQEAIDAVNGCGGNACLAAKTILGIPRETLQGRLRSAALVGLVPHKMEPTLQFRMPLPYAVKKTVHKPLKFNRPIKIFVLPDAQVKPGIDLSHLALVGRYVAEKKPDVIVCIGDFADMSSLSSYDVGKKSFEGRSYKADIAAAKAGMITFLSPIKKEMEKADWRPRFVLTLGNHENRIDRAVENDRKLDGTIGIEDLGYDKDWEVYPFLEPVEIAGIQFCHYFTSGVMGRPITTANALINKKHQSCVAGHQQGRQVAYGQKADGSQITAIIAGSCYLHNEDYLGYQGNKHWRGCFMLHECENGSSDEMFVSLKYLAQRYAK